MCQETLDLSMFHNRSASVDGKAHRCKTCVSRNDMGRYATDPDYFLSRNRQWRVDNLERKKATDRAWKQANRERVHAMERNRLHIRRAKIRDAVANDPRLMRAEKIIYGQYGTVCMWPGCTTDDPSLDHIVPFALGGLHELDNLQVLCKRHNMSKQHREAVDYRPQPLEVIV